MAKQILVIFIGGTICTTIHNGQMDTDPAAASALIALYREQYKGEDVTFTLGKNFGFLSENLTISHWNAILEELRAVLSAPHQYDGIILAHGTDTLAYTAALLSVVLKGIGIPVVLVSSHHPILRADGTPNPVANGVDNFAAAVTCIRGSINPDVYATYRNPADGVMYLHRGAHLTQCRIYDDNFYSHDAFPLTDTVPDLPEAQAAAPLPLFNFSALQDCVLKIDPYVGLNYQRLSLEGVKAVLHGVYHSGTACVDDGDSPASILSLVNRCAKAHIPFYLAPAKTSEEKTVYASVSPLEQFRSPDGQTIRFSYGHTMEWVYAALIYGTSAGLTAREIETLIQ